MDITRRSFVTQAAVAGIAGRLGAAPLPWYRTAMRWGQTNITERDPVRYDIAWWREYWRQTSIQGVIINAGGIVAYYPSKFPLQHRAEFLNGRDLYGELVTAARAEKLAVIARMDSNRTSEDFYKAHPNWFARMASGEPYRAADKYVTCVNSDYYNTYLPQVMTEIIERSHPDGFADNSWSGLRRGDVCYCENCARIFRDKYRHALPKEKNWDDSVYRSWIEWNYDRRIEVWDLNNRATKAAGGPDCIWMGMNSGSITSQSDSFRDMKRICERSPMLLLDHQSRTESTGFQQNTDAGVLVHGILGWDRLAPESMALYQAPSRPGEVSFRVASKPPEEARMWMLAGFAGGIQPWWHHVGAYHEDRRMYHTAQPVFTWHKVNERYLVNRVPVAPVAIAWSQKNTDYFGRDDAGSLVDLPYRGMAEALMRARIPYIPVHIDRIASLESDVSVLVLPNLGALSDAQCTAIRDYVAKGGSLIATGATSLYNEWGDSRTDFGLAGLFKAHRRTEPVRPSFAKPVQSYLRLSPERRGNVWGPKVEGEPTGTAERHPVLRGFDETDILPFGFVLDDLKVDEGATVPLTYVPPFPVFPPETAWMRQPSTTIPGLVLSSQGQARVAYLPAPLDACYGRDHLSDHADMLANIVRWALAGRSPLDVSGPGFLDCRLYRQEDHFVLHMLNLSNEAAWRAPVEEILPVGPIEVRVRRSGSVQGRSVRSLVSSQSFAAQSDQDWLRFTVPAIREHEVLVIG